MKEFYTMIQGIGELQRELRSFFSGVKSPAYPPNFLNINWLQAINSIVNLLCYYCLRSARTFLVCTYMKRPWQTMPRA